MYIVVEISDPFLFLAEYYFIGGMCHSLFIYSLTDGHLGRFQSWGIMYKAPMNTLMQIFLWSYVLIFLG